MNLPKKILFYSLLLLLTLTAVEGMSRSAYYLAYGEWYSPPLPPDTAAAVAANSVELPAPPNYEPGGWRTIHPYYGYTDALPRADLNRMPPRQTGADRVVIGVSGGSVADQAIPYFRRAVRQYFADNALAKEPVIIDLAQIAKRQPMQLGTVNYLLAMGGAFDIIVNLDGFNELLFSYRNFHDGLFPFYPASWDWLNHWTMEEIALVGQIRGLRDEQAELRQAGRARPFHFSAAYGLINRYRRQSVANRISQLNHALTETQSGYSLQRHGPRGNFRDVSAVHHEAVRVWYRSSALLAYSAQAAGADYYHFLQPNLHLPDSKPLSPVELRRFYSPARLSLTGYPETYAQLTQYGQELQRRQVNYFDLTRIFVDHPETLYADRCCHLNDRGNELLAAAMVQRMEPALLRRGRARGQIAESILAVAAPPRPPPPPRPRLFC